MERITLLREVRGQAREVWVDVWQDGSTNLYHARAMFEAWPRNKLRFEDGVKSIRAAEKMARSLADELRADGWKDKLAPEEQARVDARSNAWEQNERDVERRREERLDAFPVSALDRRLAEALAKPGGVTELDLRGRSGDRLTVVPPEVKKLKQLEILRLECNDLDELPEELGKLSALRAIHLAHNRLNDLPRGLWYQRRLAVLDLHDNRFTEIYEHLGDYQKKGLELQIAGNPLKKRAHLGPFDKMVVLGIDTAALFPIAKRAERGEDLATLHLYGKPPNKAQAAEIARCFPRAKVTVFDRAANGPHIVTRAF